jgi:hypothetical protein
MSLEIHLPSPNSPVPCTVVSTKGRFVSYGTKTSGVSITSASASIVVTPVSGGTAVGNKNILQGSNATDTLWAVELSNLPLNTPLRLDMTGDPTSNFDSAPFTCGIAITKKKHKKKPKKAPKKKPKNPPKK